MLNRLTVLGLLSLITIHTASAAVMTDDQVKNLTISRIEVTSVEGAGANEPAIEWDQREGIPFKAMPMNVIDPGKVISVAKDLVALGESVYSLVQKGKPTNTTTYAPISVVPKINGQPADVFDLENFKAPAKYTFEIKFYNLLNVNVVNFRYSVLFSYGGTYNGKGAYLTSVQIIPESVRTLFGFDFTATMKLGGLQNSGSKANPVAGATLLLDYNVSSVMTKITKVNTFYVTGRGGFKAYK